MTAMDHGSASPSSVIASKAIPSRPTCQELQRAEPCFIDQIVSDTVLDAAVKALGRKRCSPKLRHEIRAACIGYLSGAKPSARARRSFTLKQAAAIKAAASKLSHLLLPCLRMDVSNSSEDELAVMLLVSSRQQFDIAKLGDLVVELTELAEAAENVRDCYLPDKGGPNPDIELHVMLAKLKALYKAVVRRKATVTRDNYGPGYSGSFLAFVEPIVTALDEAMGRPRRSNAALGGVLAKITAKRKKPPTARLTKGRNLGRT